MDAWADLSLADRTLYITGFFFRDATHVLINIIIVTSNQQYYFNGVEKYHIASCAKIVQAVIIIIIVFLIQITD